jgi:hypothetical protein
MEDSGLMVCGIWCCIIGCVFPNISEVNIAFSRNGQAYQKETKKEK